MSGGAAAAAAPVLAKEADRATALDRLAREALDWAAAPTAPEGAGGGTLLRDLRRDARRARSLSAAARRPVAVAVFGPSQAGKSYLISSLAAPLGQPVTVQFGATRLNFLRDVNPQNENESTGIVSRFTLARPAVAEDAPVVLRIFSQTDVVKILANTYLEDFTFDAAGVLAPDQQEAHLLALEAGAGPAPCDALDADAVEDLQDYFRAHFRDRQVIAALSQGFWDRLAQLAPRLPAERRAEAFAPLWGRVPGFTRLCADLLGALKRLGFPEEVHAGLDALTPRETGVLSVRTLFTLGTPAAGQVMLRNPAAGGGGAPVPVDRAVVTALISELVVPVSERPWAFFDHTDLLDFPGARSRYDLPDAQAFLEKEAKNLGEAFLRAKVAYLFQRYNAEQEISAMMLCVGPSVQEVQTLPRMVSDWIALAAGETPEARAGKPANLFLVLTKFDTQFVEKQGEDIESGQAWTGRLQASFLDLFAKGYDWPNAWAPGRPFDNLFWLRSPAVGFDGVLDYETLPDGRRAEAGILPRAAATVARRREAYLANALVRRHFADPARAFEEAMRLNDGGIGHLAAALAPVCDPGLKARQLAARAAALSADIAARLRPFHRSGDAEARVREARRRAAGILRGLAQCAQAQMLGPLLRALMVDTDAVSAVHWRLQADATAGRVVFGATGGATVYETLVGGLLDEQAPEGDAAPAPAGPRDLFEHLAGLAIEDWDARMRGLAEDAGAVAGFLLPREALLDLVEELGQAARRLGLRERIARALRERAGFEGRFGAMEAKRIAIVEEMLNAFVHTQGWLWADPAKRPKRGRAEDPQRSIFLPRAPDRSPPALPPQPAAYDVDFNADWMAGLVALMEANARSEDGVEYDIAANARLGRILEGLALARGMAVPK